METITFAIKRFDGERSWSQEYRFEREVNTLLGCLNKIREEQDDSLCFTQACRHSICGSCAVQVNGSAFLACETQLDELIDIYQTTRFVIEPLGNFPVVRDLVVSFDEKAEKMKRAMPWMCEREDRCDHTQPDGDYRKYMQATDCVLCGCCTSSCRELAYDDGSYLDPFMFNKAYRFVRDSRDGCANERVEAALENNLWKCIHCQQCVTTCPKDIPIAEEIAYLRRRALRTDHRNSEGARHALSFHHDVLSTGLLNEMRLALKTEGLYKTAENRLPFGMRMVVSGKMNPLHVQKPVNGIDGVRKLHQFAEEMDEED